MTIALRVQVLIPTYNRSTWAEMQARSLFRLRQELLKSSIDLTVLISDNKSDIPVKVPVEIQSFTHLISPESHLSTAEENLVFGLEKCTAEYIWVLGDDDTIILENVISLFKSLISDKPDFIIGNSSGALTDGTFVKSRTSCSEPGTIEDLPDFITRTGLWFVIAGFSCLIFKREPMLQNLGAFKKYFAVSKIYSHVFWLMDTFWTKKFRYFDCPIVVYKQNASDVASDLHWNKVSAKENVFNKYFWTVGFIKHAKMLREHHQIPVGFFSNVIDQGWDSRFLHLPMVLSIFINVLEGKYIDRGNVCRSITNEEKFLFIDFISYEDGRLADILALAMVNDFHGARVQLQKYEEGKFYNYFIVKSMCGWTIYHFDNVYRAVPQYNERFCWQELFDIAPVTSKKQLVARDLEGVEKLARANPFPVHAPHPIDYSSLVTKAEVLFMKRIIRIYYKIKFLLPIQLIKKIK